MPVTLTDDALDVTPQTTVAGNVLSNDTDVPPDPILTFEGVTATSGPQSLIGTYGVLTFTEEGSVSYTPHPWVATEGQMLLGNTLQDSFDYSVSDGGSTDTAELLISVSRGAAIANVVEHTSAGASFHYDEIVGSTTSVGFTETNVTLATGVTGTVTVLHDYSGAQTWQVAWQVDSADPDWNLMGRYNDDDSISLLTLDRADTQDWHTREIRQQGLGAAETEDFFRTNSDYFSRTAEASNLGFDGQTPVELGEVFAHQDIASEIAALPGTVTFLSITDFLDNGNTRVTTFDFISNPGQAYSSVEINADGDVVANIQTRANGITTRTNVDDGGAATSRIMTDANDVQAWASKTLTFDDTASVTQRAIAYDNGDTLVIDYLPSGGWTATWTDGNDSSSWSTRARTFDALDQLTDTFTFFDNGDTLETTYDTDGDPLSTTLTDVSDSIDRCVRQPLLAHIDPHFRR